MEHSSTSKLLWTKKDCLTFFLNIKWLPSFDATCLLPEMDRCRYRMTLGRNVSSYVDSCSPPNCNFKNRLTNNCQDKINHSTYSNRSRLSARVTMRHLVNWVAILFLLHSFLVRDINQRVLCTFPGGKVHPAHAISRSRHIFWRSNSSFLDIKSNR